MRIYKLINKSRLTVLWAGVLSSIAFLLIFPTECRNGATNGVYLCLQVLIPSLFPFMIISSFVSSSRLIHKIPKAIARIMKYVFGLPPCAFAPVFLSLIGGYPVGTASIKELYRQGHLTKQQSERMAMFCVSAGPGFLLTYIGVVMTRNLKLGYILLVSQTISLFVLGIAARFFIKTTDNTEAEGKFISQKHQSLTDTITYSIESTIKNTASMCALVIIFSAVSEVFIVLCKENQALFRLTALIEITNGVKILADTSGVALLAFVCGFGGLCVHFQIFAQLKGIGISKGIFYVFRVLQGLLCAGISSLLIKLFPIAKPVFSTVKEADTEFYTTSAGCVFLILVCAAFIVSAKQRRI